MEERSKKTKNAGIYGIIGNIFLLIIKAIVGVVSKSQAMIADSINSAGDIFASLMTFIGNKIASVPKDEDHNLGHGKAEYIFSMFISISMILVSAKLLYDSVMTLIQGSELKFSWFLVLVCVITIITKLVLYIYVKKLLKNEENILLEANMEDHKNDCIVTTFTLISIILTKVNIYWFDSVVGIGISLWICYIGTKIFMESYNILMDVSVDEETKDLIITIANNNEEIEEIRSIISTPIGYKYIIILTIAVSGEMTTRDSHNLADKLESDIANLEKVDKAIVHVEPD